MKQQADISICEIKENKEAYLNLLLIADPSVDMIRHYLDRGDLYVMQLEETPVCVTVVVSDKGTALSNHILSKISSSITTPNRSLKIMANNVST
jgi:hypothetical protein